MSINVADWLADTRDQRVVSKDTLLNEATKNTYFTQSRMFRNAERKFKGGKNLVDHIQGTATGGRWYNPLAKFNPSVRNSQTSITVPWAFLTHDYVIIDEADALNSGDPAAFVDYVMSLEQECMVGKLNTLEESAWALPNKETMEDTVTNDTDTQEPFSLLAFVTRDGLAPGAGNGGIAVGSTAWTTIQGVNPTTNTWYRNKFGTYSASNPNDLSGGIIAAFDDMFLQTGFQSPDMLKNGAAPAEEPSKRCIVTSREGQTMYIAALRSVNDRMNNLYDPSIGTPMFRGVGVHYVSELDNAGWTAAQPDYLFLDFSVMFPFIHTDTYFREKVTPGGPDQPNATVVHKFTWTNRICRSRRRQGRVYAA